MARKFLEIIKPYANEIKCMDYKNQYDIQSTIILLWVYNSSELETGGLSINRDEDIVLSLW